MAACSISFITACGCGFADASLQELEKATGVNKSGLYSEFSGEGGSVSGELALLPRSPAAAQLAHGRAPPGQLIAKNIEAEDPKADVNDLASIVLTFFTGLSVEQNLKPNHAATGRRVDNLMRVLRNL